MFHVKRIWGFLFFLRLSFIYTIISWGETENSYKRLVLADCISAVFCS